MCAWSFWLPFLLDLDMYLCFGYLMIFGTSRLFFGNKTTDREADTNNSFGHIVYLDI